MPTSLTRLYNSFDNDTGLVAHVPAAQFTRGLDAVTRLQDLMTTTLDGLHLNDDKLISMADMAALSAAIQSSSADYLQFMNAHGDDEGNVETGFHLFQNDGGTLMFQGRKFVDTVADAIFHYGFAIDVTTGRFLNEDGNQNEQVADVAGWLNYFANGVNVVWGAAGADELGSGDYSAVFTAAANETFYADAGNDRIWAEEGNDIVWGGTGDDASGGGTGNDTMNGEAGSDTLWGEEGNDVILTGLGNDHAGGGLGNDSLSGSYGADTLYGEEGRDTLAGDAGADMLGGGDDGDVLAGGAGNDTVYGDSGDDSLAGGDGADGLWGSDGRDTLSGDAGDDKLGGGEGCDTLMGGAGSDEISLWENVQSRDNLVFKAGDSGKTMATIDHVAGFESGVDKIDLRAFHGMTFEELDYRGGGDSSCYFDGRYLRIDINGDAASDMIVEFKWQDELVAADFLFA